MYKKNQNNRLLIFIFQMLQPFKWLLCGQIICAIICALDISIRPYLIKKILNTLSLTVDNNSLNQLIYFASIYLCMAIILFMIFRIRDLLLLHFSPNFKKNMGLHMMDLLMNQSHHFFQNNFSGSLSNKISDIISGTIGLVKIVIDDFFTHLLAVCIAIYTVSHVAVFFSIALSIWIGIFVFISVALSKRGAYYADCAAEQKSVVFGNIVDVLSNMMSVRLFGAQTVEHTILAESMTVSVHKDQQRNWFYLKLHAAQGLSFILFQALCFWWLIKGFTLHTVTTGDFALILGINLAIVNCLWNISKDMRDFSENLGDVVQGLRTVITAIEVVDKPTAQDLCIMHGSIVFENVSFCYKDAPPFFQNKTITILPGQKVGLVGYSGSGKSTFVNLILRLFDVTQGRILIDGQDIKEVTQHSLHDVIGIIPQEPSLFHRSIIENIRYGRPTACDKDVIIAAQKAYAHDFITSQPHGYLSTVGERGAKLSGGQKQRIIIARIILKDPRILILDEATSQLDSVTEDLIQKSLWSLMQNKTTLVVAHRLSTLLQMDRILVFDQGNIIQDGFHNDLLSQEGLYRTLWQTQIGGMLPENESM